MFAFHYSMTCEFFNSFFLVVGSERAQASGVIRLFTITAIGNAAGAMLILLYKRLEILACAQKVAFRIAFHQREQRAEHLICAHTAHGWRDAAKQRRIFPLPRREHRIKQGL